MDNRIRGEGACLHFLRAKVWGKGLILLALNEMVVNIGNICKRRQRTAPFLRAKKSVSLLLCDLRDTGGLEGAPKTSSRIQSSGLRREENRRERPMKGATEEEEKKSKVERERAEWGEPKRPCPEAEAALETSAAVPVLVDWPVVAQVAPSIDGAETSSIYTLFFSRP